MKKIPYYGDICIIKSPSNLFYLSGYDNADSIIAIDKEGAYYFTDSRYFEEVTSLLEGFEIKNIADFGNFIEERKARIASVESSISYNDYLFFKEKGIEDFHFIDKEISRLRAIKSEKEIKIMQKAQAITDHAFDLVLNDIKEGMTERELASALEAHLFGCGGDALAFTSIVAFGVNTSKPHAHRGETKLKKGMAVTMDFGAKYQGYCSDMTRTVFFGKPCDELKDIYNYVREAQSLALDTVRPGMVGRDVDEIARGYFRNKGLDKYFIHSLGHSLGIDIHENPNFSPKCSDVITKGMTLSVEPGLYIAGKYGVRIEDVIYFEENGIRNLTKSPKNMIII